MTGQEFEGRGDQASERQPSQINRRFLGKLWRDLEITLGLIASVSVLAALRNSNHVNTQIGGIIIGFQIEPVLDPNFVLVAAATGGSVALLEIGRRRFHL